MSFNIILNNNNIINSNNTNFLYEFTNNNFSINENSELCISSFIIPYSWFNINKQFYNNTIIKYYFPNGATSNLYTIDLPNGFYNINQINNYIQLIMINNNQYFINSNTGKNIYYIEFLQNATYYANQIILNLVPLSIPLNYSVPSVVINGYTYTGFNCNTTTAGNFGGNNNFWPSSSVTCQINIPSYNGIYGIGSILGFTQGNYPTTPLNYNYNVLSNIIPNASPVNSLIVRCNLINNECSNQSDVLDVIPITGANFGSNINYNPPFQKWISLRKGIYDSLLLYIQDQNYNTLQILDPNITISLLLKQGK